MRDPRVKLKLQQNFSPRGGYPHVKTHKVLMNPVPWPADLMWLISHLKRETAQLRMSLSAPVDLQRTWKSGPRPKHADITDEELQAIATGGDAMSEMRTQ